MTTEELAAIKARCDAANVWTADQCDVPEPDEDGYQTCPSECTSLGDTLIQFCGSYEGGGHDWKFIAHARQDVPALLAEIERLRALLKEARVKLHHMTIDSTTMPEAELLARIDAELEE